MDKYMSLFWKLYAVLLVASYIASFFIHPLDVGALLPTVFAGVGIVGLAGFAYGIPIGPRIFWRIYFALLILFIGLFLGFFALSVFNAERLADMLLPAMSLVFCVLPLSYALWAYAYKSSPLWSKNA